MTPTIPGVREPWPVWSKVLLAAVVALVVVTLLPWVFMTWAMATSCMPMMTGMMEMMRGGMMR